uniref:Ovule protein n=1 Tax=Meloidogyne incognita TaxID=6306 RepID=A0A914LHP5_MELIC
MYNSIYLYLRSRYIFYFLEPLAWSLILPSFPTKMLVQKNSGNWRNNRGHDPRGMCYPSCLILYKLSQISTLVQTHST